MTNFKRKFSFGLILILAILSTICTCFATTEVLTELRRGEVIVDSKHIHTYPDGSYIPANELYDYYDLYCCQRGTALTGYPKTYLVGSNGDELGVSYPYLTYNDIGMTILNRREPFPSSTYKNKTIGHYRIAGTYIATPEEAYVLSEMILADGLGQNDYTQWAWWRTEAGSTGGTYEVTDFSQEAKAFEAYVLQAAEVTSTDQLQHKTAQFITAEGETKTYENAFDFEYEPEWVSTDEYADVQVVWDSDTKQFTIGPFAIDYVGSTEKFGERPEVQFAGITGMNIYTDASSEPLVFEQDWNYVWVDGERTEETDSKYPLANEKFYIRVNYIEDATMITNIKTEFRYMNACGVYQKLDGKYFEATWRQDYQDHYTTEYDEEGEPYDVYDYTEYWLELMTMSEHDSQLLALGMNGARWYEFVEIDRNFGLKFGKLRIEKHIVDDEGNYVEGDGDYFTFNVNVEGAQNGGTDKIKVKEGSAATSKVYWWFEGEEAPKFTISEDPNEDYELVSITPSSGSLEEFKTVNVIALNRKEHNGSLQLIKEIEDLELNGRRADLEGETFEFNVKLIGSFEYNGTKVKNGVLDVPAILTIQNNKATWDLGNVKWFGDTAPKFVITESTDNKTAELVSITPSTGSLEANETVKVVAVNRPTIERGQIKVIKTLENAELYPEEEIMKLGFNFLIKVDGYKDIDKTIYPVKEDGKYVWRYITGYYRWFHGENPNYSITEHDNPEGTEIKEIIPGNPSDTVNGSTVSGTFQDGDGKVVVIENNFINKITEQPHKGKIVLTKTVDEDTLIDRDFKFVVTVDGTFEYLGTKYENAKIKLTSNPDEPVADASEIGKFVVIHIDSTKVGTWSSDEFTWYGDTAPKYSVEEDLVGEDVASSIEPSEGYLSDGVDEGGVYTVKVNAWNRDNGKAGYIHIIKTLENADKVSKEYVESLKFTFRIKVENYEEYTVTLDAKKVDNSYVWEYKSGKFNWRSDEEPLDYEIEEINLPDGVVFVSANGESNIKVTGQLIENNANEQDAIKFTVAEYLNKIEPKEKEIIIEKKVVSGSLNGVPFSFNVTLTGSFEYNGNFYYNTSYTFPMTVNGGSSASTGAIKWYGEKGPHYDVTEIESEKAEVISVLNSSGELTDNATATIVTFTNEPKKTGGYLEIEKVVEGQIQVDDEFTFEVKIGDNDPYQISIKAGEVYRSDYYEWYVTESAPTYEVRELTELLPEGCEFVRIDNATGTLPPDGASVKAIAYNRYVEKQGNFTILKEIVADEKLLDGMDLPTFDITVNITGVEGGRFEFEGETYYGTESATYTISLKGGETYTSPMVKWYGNAAPTVVVSEENLPLGWKNVNISNNNAQLGEETVNIVVTNQLDTITIIDLTMQLAGYVWQDAPKSEDGKNTEDSVANGLKDEFEKAIKGIEVYIYNPDGTTLAEVYDNGALISQPIITDAIGHWVAPSLKMPQDGTYDVEFVYDGQTYEPTIFLATSNGDANAYRSASTADRDRWEKDSKALDYDRAVVNDRIQEIYEGSPIDGAGVTVGYVNGSSGEQPITYKSNNFNVEQDNRATTPSSSTRVKSEVQTTNENGSIMELFKTKARTSVGGLTYPFDKKIHLDSVDTYISELGLVQYYKYSATYNYMLNINLGLVPRDEADLGISKDLDSAKVIVNNHLTNHKFNTLDDYNQDLVARQINGDTMGVEYQLALRSSDYFYRAELYGASAESSNMESYDAITDYYAKQLNMSLKETELEVYLTYRIRLYNESANYNVKINRINDYFDSSFGKPIDRKVEQYVETVDGQEVKQKVEIANASTVNGTPIAWYDPNELIEGSDGTIYRKQSADLGGLMLGAGERAEILVTVKLEKATIGEVHDAIELGDKSNVAEIASYQTFYPDGKNAGKIDRDSAPGNVNIREYNAKRFYEDDTDQAPVLKLTVKTDSSIVEGRAWEDNAAKGKVGEYDENDEALIAGLTTQIVEKVKVKREDGKYVEYDFIWPTNKPLSMLGGSTIQHLTGFDSTVETATKENANEIVKVGSYRFNNVPEGNYAVRFVYGNNKLDLEDTLDITGDPVAVNSNGDNFSGNANILTANYDNDPEGKTVAVYNGQDHKTTVYQTGHASVDGNNYLNNEYHNLDSREIADKGLSDARDNESRRLELIANSETIMNTEATILATANNKAADHTELYDKYNMFAETATIKVKSYKEGEAIPAGVAKVATQTPMIQTSAVKVENVDSEYTITRIDCGIVERPETAVVLDKQIESIKLITNDNRVVFHADYEITPKFVKEGSITKDTVVLAKVGDYFLTVEKTLKANSIAIDQLQSIDKVEDKVDETLNGVVIEDQQYFRYINVDDAVLQGTTIEINYDMTAYNVGEKDMTSALLADIEVTAKAEGKTIKEKLTELANVAEVEARESASYDKVPTYGKYLGTTYYAGIEGNDKVVTTRVRQVVDYIDNDAVYTQAINAGKDHSWRNTSLNELDGNGYEAERLVSRDVIPGYELIDQNGIAYITDQKNNVVLSIDPGEYQLEETVAVSTNSGFTKELVPVELDGTLTGADVLNPDDYKASIDLTITRTVSAEDDADKLQFDNIAEIVKIENSVGRRDMLAVVGNASPVKGAFVGAVAERDSSATELVTFAPPTGIRAEATLTTQILLISLLSLVILAVGVVILKKTVLK